MRRIKRKVKERIVKKNQVKLKRRKVIEKLRVDVWEREREKEELENRFIVSDSSLQIVTAFWSTVDTSLSFFWQNWWNILSRNLQMVFWEFVVCVCFSVEDGQARIRMGRNLGEECSVKHRRETRKERKKKRSLNLLERNNWNGGSALWQQWGWWQLLSYE